MNNIVTLPDAIGGVDGCPGGWILVKFQTKQYSVSLHPTISDLIERHPNLEKIWIDMPIGLSGKTFSRTVDSLIRQALPGKASSIFNPPCRQALYAKNHREASQKNREITGKGLSIQSWNIATRIRDLDEWIQSNNRSAPRFVESSPELCFSALNEGKTVIEKKSGPLGQKIRKQLIARHDPDLMKVLEETRKKYTRSQVKTDDILDAMALLICNRQNKESKNRYLNDPNVKDEKGIYIRIAWPNGIGLPGE